MDQPSPAARHAELLAAFRAGRRGALARAITIVENERAGFDTVLDALHDRLGRAHRIGLTGPPGAGKSTLTAALIRHYREQGESVGVVAVDPTSPFTGGALLGDRIRMNELSTDPGVFVRSMATRGSLGGLALATKEVADVLDAFGFDRVLIETVGVGQSELDIAAAADTTVVLLVPESGDSIQTMKAGLMEASDIFVVNKADRPGADRLAREIGTMLHLRLRDGGGVYANVPAHHGVDMKRAARRGGGAAASAADARARPTPAPAPAPARDPRPYPPYPPWSIPVLKTVAVEDDGIGELAEAVDRHRAWLDESGERERRRGRRLAERVREEVDRSLRRMVWMEGDARARLDAALPELLAGRATPYQVAARIVRASLARPAGDAR
jgi:LAO/AO transport system kinase